MSILKPQITKELNTTGQNEDWQYFINWEEPIQSIMFKSHCAILHGFVLLKRQPLVQGEDDANK